MSVDPSKYSTIVNVRNIGEAMTVEQLEGMFSTYGTITSCKIMRSENVESGRFAYVAFEDPDAAEEAIIELNCQEFAEGQRIYVRRSGEKLERQPKPKKRSPESSKVETTNRCEIFVRNLDPAIDAEELRSMFRYCGTVTSAKVIMENGHSKGYGFVSFATQEAANTAVTEMHGKRIPARSFEPFVNPDTHFLRLHVALANGTDRSKNSRDFSFRTPLRERLLPRSQRLTPNYNGALRGLLKSLDKPGSSF